MTGRAKEELKINIEFSKRLWRKKEVRKRINEEYLYYPIFAISEQLGGGET